MQYKKYFPFNCLSHIPEHISAVPYLMTVVPKGTNHPLYSIVLGVIQTLRGPFPTQLMSLEYKHCAQAGKIWLQSHT